MIGDLTVDGLAVFRLTRLLIDDSVAQPARDLIVDVASAVGGNRGEEWAVEGLGCYWCSGWWIAIVVAVIRPSFVWRWVRYPLALSAIAGKLGG